MNTTPPTKASTRLISVAEAERLRQSATIDCPACKDKYATEAVTCATCNGTGAVDVHQYADWAEAEVGRLQAEVSMLRREVSRESSLRRRIREELESHETFLQHERAEDDKAREAALKGGNDE